MAVWEELSTSFGDLQHQGIQPSKHLNLLQQKLHVITISRAMIKVGIPKTCLDPNSHGVGALVFASTVSNLAMLGPKSVKEMYCAPLSVSALCDFLAIAPAISIPPPNSRPEANILPLFLRPPTKFFLGCFGHSLLNKPFGVNLILEGVTRVRTVKGPDLFLFERFEATWIDYRNYL